MKTVAAWLDMQLIKICQLSGLRPCPEFEAENDGKSSLIFTAWRSKDRIRACRSGLGCLDEDTNYYVYNDFDFHSWDLQFWLLVNDIFLKLGYLCPVSESTAKISHLCWQRNTTSLAFCKIWFTIFRNLIKSNIVHTIGKIEIGPISVHTQLYST